MNKPLKAPFGLDEYVQIFQFYQDRYGSAPSTIDYLGEIIDHSVLIVKLKESGLQETEPITRYYIDVNESSERLSFYYAFFKGEVAVCLGGNGDPSTSISVFHNANSDQEALQQMKAVVRSCMKTDPKKEGYFGFPVFEYGSFSLKTFQSVLPSGFIESFELYYNDDFIDVHTTIIDQLNAGDKGVVLLHGDAGTGKTTYLKYLATQVGKKFVLISQELSGRLSSPDFISFMIEHKGSVLVFEDAEKVITDRSTSTESNSVSALLNIADGILSDLLNIQIICTFNTKLGNVDQALLRKGRIIARYEFNALSAEKSNALLKQLGADYTTDKPMVLADVFNAHEQGWTIERKSIGFKK